MTGPGRRPVTLGGGRERMGDAAHSKGARVDGHLPMVGGPVVLAALLATGVTAAEPVEPLEVVAVDVSAYPTVVLDVALPAWESVEQVGPDAFTVEGAAGVAVERLDPADLTVAFVVDNGRHVPRATLAAHQGAAIELVRNLPDGVTVALGTTSGPPVAPTNDRGAIMEVLSRLDTADELDGATLGPAILHAAAVLEVAGDSRRQLMVFTGDTGDVTAAQANAIAASLDRSLAAMRVVAVGDDVGANLELAAIASGGVAVAIGEAGGAIVRAVDVLTTTLADQYRLTATMTAPGPLVIRLTVGERSYAATVPNLGPPITAAPATTTLPTTTSTTSATSTSTAPRPTSPPAAVPEREREPSPIAGAEALFGVAAIAVVVLAVRQRRRPRRR